MQLAAALIVLLAVGNAVALRLLWLSERRRRALYRAARGFAFHAPGVESLIPSPARRELIAELRRQSLGPRPSDGRNEK